MTGISWGGFNSLQVAALRPAALRAIITLCASDDRYADDAHWMGGCPLNENLTWGSVLTLFNALPPDPEIVGERWRGMWRDRLEAARLFPAVWLEHPDRDDYWRRGSVSEEYGAIACPVYAVGGWADGYSNAVPRLLAGLTVPRKGLIGPWSHAFPHNSVPGPSIGWLQESLRWWDHWLKGRDTGIMNEPILRAWMQEHVPPRPTYRERPGRWVAEDAWPSPRIESRRYGLEERRLVAGGPPGDGRPPLVVSSPFMTGLLGGDWCAFGADGDQPADQRGDDGRSLTFDSAPLDARLEILGGPVATLRVAADRPAAMVAIRLCDVAPDGASLRVSYGLLDLAHRNGPERAEPLEPGRPGVVQVRLNDVAHAFPAGHRIRLAVSTAYWPIAWPPPEPVAVTVWPDGCSLVLPVRPPRDVDAMLRPFPEPEVAISPDHSPIRPVESHRRVERDLAANRTTYTVFSDGGDYDGAAVTHLDAPDLDVGYTMLRRFSIDARHPDGARSEIEQSALLRREGWDVRVALDTVMTATGDRYRLRAHLEARLNGERVFERDWDEGVPRGPR